MFKKKRRSHGAAKSSIKKIQSAFSGTVRSRKSENQTNQAAAAKRVYVHAAVVAVHMCVRSAKATAAGRAMLSCSTAVALAFVSAVGLNVAAAFHPFNLNKIPPEVARRGPQRFCPPQQLQRGTRLPAGAIRCQPCVDGRVVEGSSRSPLEASSSSRGQFLGKLLASSAALVVCTASAGAASGTKTGGGDSVPRRRGESAARRCPYCIMYHVLLAVGCSLYQFID